MTTPSWRDLVRLRWLLRRQHLQLTDFMLLAAVRHGMRPEPVDEWDGATPVTGRTQQWLARSTGLHPTTVGRGIHRLLREGYVTRMDAYPFNWDVTITAAGRRYLDTLDRRMANEEDEPPI